MQKPHLLAAVAVISTVSLVATAAYANTISTQDFVRKASIANRFEIESSKLALDKSQNPEIQDFAQRMIDDHMNAGERLAEVLNSANVDAQPEHEVDQKHQKMLNELEALSTDRFDRRYITMQTDAHKEAVKLFGAYSQYGKNAEVRSFAAQMLPTLKEHLTHVRKLK